MYLVWRNLVFLIYTFSLFSDTLVRERGNRSETRARQGGVCDKTFRYTGATSNDNSLICIINEQYMNNAQTI